MTRRVKEKVVRNEFYHYRSGNYTCDYALAQNEVVAAHMHVRVIWGYVFTRPRRVPHLTASISKSSLCAALDRRK
jgi:hypothetical protein